MSKEGKMKTIIKQVFEVGDKVRVVKAPRGLSNNWATGNLSGIQTVEELEELDELYGIIRISTNSGAIAPIFESEMDCLEYVEPELELHLTGSIEGEIHISESSEGKDELLTISKKSDGSYAISVWDTDNFKIKHVDGKDRDEFRQAKITLTRK